MAQTQYSRGRNIEYKAKQWLIEAGYEVIRSAGSKGKFDLVAFDGRAVRFIQTKYTATDNAKYNADEERILKTEVPPNATIELWVYRKNKGWVKCFYRYGSSCSSIELPESAELIFW